MIQNIRNNKKGKIVYVSTPRRSTSSAAHRIFHLITVRNSCQWEIYRIYSWIEIPLTLYTKKMRAKDSSDQYQNLYVQRKHTVFYFQQRQLLTTNSIWHGQQLCISYRTLKCSSIIWFEFKYYVLVIGRNAIHRREFHYLNWNQFI